MELTRREADQLFDRLDAWYDGHATASPAAAPAPAPAAPALAPGPAPAPSTIAATRVVGVRTQMHVVVAKARARIFGEA